MTQAVAYDQANLLQRLLRRVAASGPGAWLFARVLHRIDGPVFRMTRGRATVASLLSGLPVVMLTSTGAKTGQPRTVPLLGIPDGDGVAIIASNWGQYRHPAWYYNLKANPDAQISVNGVRRHVRAVPVEGRHRTEIWDSAQRVYPGYSQYERRAAHRQIVVFALNPV